MIGRDAARDALLAILADGRACVVGDAGMGKSLLLASVADALQAAGDVVLHLRGTESMREVPWGALRHSPVADALPEEAEAVAALTASIEERLAPDTIVVDEVQSLDSATIGWLRHVLRHSDLPVLLAWRTGSRTDTGLLGDLTEVGARTVVLEGLAPQHVRAIAEGQVGPVADSLLHALVDHSAGNPLLVTSLLAQWQREGVLDVAGIARLVGPASPPQSLAAAAAARLAQLPDDQRDAMLAVALAEPVRLAVIVGLVGEPALEACEAQGLLLLDRRQGEDLVLAGHPTLARAARELPDPEPTGRIAAALLAVDDPSIPVVQRGQWLLLAPDAVTAGVDTPAAVLTAAAEEARRFHDPALAARLADAALAAGAGVRARLVHAEIAMGQGRWDDAEAALAAMPPLAGDDHERVLVANAHVYVLGQLGRADEAWAVLRAATASVDAQHRPPLQVRAAINRLFEADAPGALEAAAALVDAADAPTRARACYAVAIAHGLEGDAIAAAHAADIGEDAFTGLAPTPAVTQIGPAVAGILAGDLTEAHHRATRLLDGMLAVGDREGEATGTFLLGRIALERAQVDQAVRQFTASRAAAEAIGDPVAARWAAGGLLHALLLQAAAHPNGGDDRAGEDDADPATRADALADALQAEAPAVQLFEDDVVLRALAHHAAARGDVAAAAAILTTAAARATGRRRAVHALLLRDVALLPGSPVRSVEGHQHDDSCGSARPCPAAMAAALVDPAGPDLPALEAQWATTERAGAALSAATLAARVADAVPPAAREAALWRARAGVLGGLGPRHGSAAAASLSPRQREVAERAARGESSARIAAALGLSTRTVENHLQVAYRTLGVRSRSELRSTLGA
jgi:DNA-binding CsgD family transcriptional regulator